MGDWFTKIKSLKLFGKSIANDCLIHFNKKKNLAKSCVAQLAIHGIYKQRHIQGLNLSSPKYQSIKKPFFGETV